MPPILVRVTGPTNNCSSPSGPNLEDRILNLILIYGNARHLIALPLA